MIKVKSGIKSISDFKLIFRPKTVLISLANLKICFTFCKKHTKKTYRPYLSTLTLLKAKFDLTPGFSKKAKSHSLSLHSFLNQA